MAQTIFKCAGITGSLHQNGTFWEGFLVVLIYSLTKYCCSKIFTEWVVNPICSSFQSNSVGFPRFKSRECCRRLSAWQCLGRWRGASVDTLESYPIQSDSRLSRPVKSQCSGCWSCSEGYVSTCVNLIGIKMKNIYCSLRSNTSMIGLVFLETVLTSSFN